MDSKHVTESTSGQEDIQKTWWKEAIIYQIHTVFEIYKYMLKSTCVPPLTSI